MTTTVCKAANPRECRYHGVRSSSHTRLLRDKMSLARNVYKAANTQSEQMDAYHSLQEAEADYYSTDEGRNSLVEHINKTTDSITRKHWLSILEKADQKREFSELQEASANQTANQRYVRFSLKFAPTEVETPTGQKIIKLSTGKYRSGEEYHFDWDETRGIVFYEESDDVDSIRSLGQASSLQKAKEISEDWYNRQVHARVYQH
jgi:hypothetical protein